MLEKMSIADIKKIKESHGDSTFMQVVRLQQSIYKDEIARKSAELTELRKDLKELKEYTKTGPRT